VSSLNQYVNKNNKMKRRLFLRNIGLTAASLCAARMPLFAETGISTLKVAHNIPVDKKLILNG